MQRILGQPDAIALLERAWRSGHLQHAWIFSGPPGVGKFTTAVELSKVLLDPRIRPEPGVRFEADPDSRPTKLIEAGTHPDLHVIRKELALYSADPDVRERKQRNIAIDVLREHVIGGTVGHQYFEPAVSHTPVEAKAKVFVIDEAELLDEHGQDAMLKTLEEPPKGTYLILITSRPQGLSPTIRSRCQHLRFVPLNDDAFERWLAGSGLDLAREERSWLTGFAEGSPGVALLGAASGFYAWNQTLEPLLRQGDQGRFPVTLGATMGDLVGTFADSWVSEHTGASKEAAKQLGAGHVLRVLGFVARDALARGYAASPPQDARRWLARIDLLPEAEQQLADNVNMKLVFESLAAQWAGEATTVSGRGG